MQEVTVYMEHNVFQKCSALYANYSQHPSFPDGFMFRSETKFNQLLQSETDREYLEEACQPIWPLYNCKIGNQCCALGCQGGGRHGMATGQSGVVIGLQLATEVVERAAALASCRAHENTVDELMDHYRAVCGVSTQSGPGFLYPKVSSPSPR